ncbi:hypothetical protein APS67_000420 [Streptomyces sp. AVP053U2]|nr:hypothetical protein APS67_000420 [Streptomyces sp. AVP053U2]
MAEPGVRDRTPRVFPAHRRTWPGRSGPVRLIRCPEPHQHTDHPNEEEDRRKHHPGAEQQPFDGIGESEEQRRARRGAEDDRSGERRAAQRVAGLVGDRIPLGLSSPHP